MIQSYLFLQIMFRLYHYGDKLETTVCHASNANQPRAKVTVELDVHLPIVS